MKYKVTIKSITYEVEIDDINARPVIARVDGEAFEVRPEDGDQARVRGAADGAEGGLPGKPALQKREAAASFSPNPALSGNALTAPLPGTIIEVFVKAGERVEAGQVVVIIEAMKMKNSIRSVYSGNVSEVLVSAGQSVAHKQALIKFADLGEASWI